MPAPPDRSDPAIIKILDFISIYYFIEFFNYFNTIQIQILSYEELNHYSNFWFSSRFSN